MRLKITGGRLFDPASGWQGEARDLYIRDGHLVSRLSRVDRVIDARGGVVCAGGIELRGQVATYGLNFLRASGAVPTLREAGESYAALGYTHVHEPFLTWLTANYVHRQLAALPVVDTSASLVLNLRDLDLWLRSPEDWPRVAETVQFLLAHTRSLNLRVVEPYVRYRQDFYTHRTVGLETALQFLAGLAERCGLPVAVEASPELLRLALPDPPRFHLAALGPALVADELTAAAVALLEQGATGDLGLMAPGGQEHPALLPVRLDLGWFRPLDLVPPPDPAAARRALELALQYRGANLAFSGAGPVLAPLTDYPRLWSWLWNGEARRRDGGEDLPARHYSLSEWVWATRTLPARILGLEDRGRLSPGARADVAIYDLPPDAPASRWSRGLARCRTLLKAGEVVIDDFSLVQPRVAKATYFRRTGAAAGPLLEEISQFRSWRGEHLGVPEDLGGTWVEL
jgi:formylmethanofuran dehydrogenase subunit A